MKWFSDRFVLEFDRLISLVLQIDCFVYLVTRLVFVCAAGMLLLGALQVV